MPASKASKSVSTRDFARSLISNVSLKSEIIFSPSDKHVRSIEKALKGLDVDVLDDRLLNALTLKISARLKEAPLDAIYHAFLDIPILTMSANPGQRGGQTGRSRSRRT